MLEERKESKTPPLQRSPQMPEAPPWNPVESRGIPGAGVSVQVLSGHRQGLSGETGPCGPWTAFSWETEVDIWKDMERLTAKDLAHVPGGPRGPSSASGGPGQRRSGSVQPRGRGAGASMPKGRRRSSQAEGPVGRLLSTFFFFV